ncbi:MAG: hypothetical protein R3Y67_05150 [Eubacteriales bacterium]
MSQRTKRILCIIAVLLLAGLYIATFILAIFDQSESGKWFQASLFGTVAIPLLLWLYLWVIKKWKERKH